MKKLRYGLLALAMLLSSFTPVEAGLSIGIGLPNLSIGINLPFYPELAPVPGYPVYYAPQVDGNYFFYDGMYWVYQDDNWYASSWYNGPWSFVEPEVVPLFVLRIPVRYYRQPPIYFRDWQPNAPPRWGTHWGHRWERNHRGWDKWRRSAAPARAPQPTYQRQYSGDRYPHQIEQQHNVRSQTYRYQPRDKAVRQHYQQLKHSPSAPAQQRNEQRKPESTPQQNERQRPAADEQRQQTPNTHNQNEKKQQGGGNPHESGNDRNNREKKNDDRDRDRDRGRGHND